MNTNRTYSENELIMKYEASLDSVKRKKTIQDKLSEFGYTAKLIAEGQALLNEANKAIRAKKDEYIKSFEAHNTFKTLLQELSESYNQHRNLAKVVFRKDDNSLKKLVLNGTKPKTYKKSLEGITTFYAVATSDPEIQSELARLRLTAEKLEALKDLIGQVEAAREHYTVVNAKAQDTTKIKNEAFAKMADWMRDFYVVAKIALADHPQLLKALVKPV